LINETAGRGEAGRAAAAGWRVLTAGGCWLDRSSGPTARDSANPVPRLSVLWGLQRGPLWLPSALAHRNV
jgi:hypothetical protein